MQHRARDMFLETRSPVTWPGFHVPRSDAYDLQVPAVTRPGIAALASASEV
jgi:hypothetical protein